MKPVFVDTAGWMMLTDGADPEHAAACRFRDAWLKSGHTFVTTDYVTDETLTLIRMRLGVDAAEAWWDMVSESQRVRTEPIDGSRAERARAWFFRWREQPFSFTDCTSFVLMRELKLSRALTSDHHFTIAGFETAPSATRRRRR